MKAIITQATEIDFNGQQSVTFDIIEDSETLVSSQTLTQDVETIEQGIRTLVLDFQFKYLSDKKLKVGDEVTL